MVLDVSVEKIIENSIYNLKFTNRSNGGVNILEIKIRTKRSQKESPDKISGKSNPMNNTIVL